MRGGDGAPGGWRIVNPSGQRAEEWGESENCDDGFYTEDFRE